MIIPVEAENLVNDIVERNDSSPTIMTNDILASPASAGAISTANSSTGTTVNNSSNNNKLVPNCSHNKLARSSSSKYVLGVVYIQEYLPHVGEQKGSEEISIGTLILAEAQRTVYAHQLRQMVVQQSLFNMDNNYVFLTNFGQVIFVFVLILLIVLFHLFLTFCPLFTGLQFRWHRKYQLS